MADCERSTLQAQQTASQATGLLNYTVSPDDTRSNSAMDELASLMLEMDIEEKGEPSFTIAAGRRKSSHTANRDFPAEGTSSARGWSSAKDVTVSAELLQHLVDCFVTHFNLFHQFLDCHEVADVRSHGLNVVELDRYFRNTALLAVAACFSDREDAKALGTVCAQLETLPLQCIKEFPSDLVVQGLVLLSWRELMFGTINLAYNYVCECVPSLL